MNEHPKHLLYYVRKAHGFDTGAAFGRAVSGRAAQLGLGHLAARREKVSRWEHGVEPDDPTQTAIADLVRVPLSQVRARGWPDWLVLALPGPDVGAPFTREAMVSTLDDLANRDPSVGEIAALLPESVLTDLTSRWTEHVQSTIARGLSGGYVGEEVAAALHARLTGLWHLDDSVGGTLCTDGARTDLRTVIRLLRHARHQGQRTTDLLYLAAEYSRFLGWAQFDAGNTPEAGRAWHAALRASAETADPAHSAYLLSNVALAQVYDGSPRMAVGLLATARTIAGTRVPPVVNAMIDTWRVRAHAAAGDRGTAARLLLQAEEEYDAARPGDAPAWAYWMCRPSHMAETGRAFLDLGDHSTAENLLGEGLTALGSTSPRDRVLYQTWIAEAQIGRGALDAAAQTAHLACDTAATVESGRCSTLLQDLHARLRPHGNSAAVAPALERLTAISTAKHPVDASD